MKLCVECGNPKSRKGEYCKACSYKHRTRRSGLIYIKHKENPTSFKKGQTPWNLGIVGAQVAWNKGTKGVMPSNKTSFTSEAVLGEKNNKWKGDAVGYYALHAWLIRKYGKPISCEHCGSVENVQWASKDYLYKRDRESWLTLCLKCHRKYDSTNGWGAASKIFPEIKGGKRCATA